VADDVGGVNGVRGRQESAARRCILRTLALAVVLLAGVSVVGFGGRLWWVFDGFSHFRVQYLTALLACTLPLAALRRWRWAAAFAAVKRDPRRPAVRRRPLR
jgi:hypothetical protein